MPTTALKDSRVPHRRQVRIELLALDLNGCGRCTRTDRNLEAALGTATAVLRERNIDVEVVKHVVASADQAERLRFLSSPTIRIDGGDIALDLRESPCEDCGEICGCEGGVSCRVWVWEGKEHVEAPTAMIVDAVLKAAKARGAPAKGPPAPYRMPENLRRFFASLARKDAGTTERNGTRSSCCDPSSQSLCCGSSP